MQSLASFQRSAFLTDHPPVSRRMILTSSGSEQTLLAGTVLGSHLVDSKTILGPWQPNTTVIGVLAEDVTVPADGDAYAEVYIHAAVVASRLLWADGVSAADQHTALAALRGIGLFACEG